MKLSDNVHYCYTRYYYNSEFPEIRKGQIVNISWHVNTSMYSIRDYKTNRFYSKILKTDLDKYFITELKYKLNLLLDVK